jgi:hypothetical protein
MVAGLPKDGGLKVSPPFSLGGFLYGYIPIKLGGKK